MSERTTVVNGTGGGAATLAIIALVLIVIVVAFLFLGGGRAVFPSNIDVDINQPQNPPAQQPPQQTSPMSYQLVLPSNVTS